MKRKGNVKIFALMLFILAGLAFVFLASGQSDNNQARQSAQAVNQDSELQLAQFQDDEVLAEADKEEYSKKLSEFKRMAMNLEQKDTMRFKIGAKEAFMELAALMEELKTPEMEEEDQEELKADLNELKMSARKLVVAEKPEDLVAGLKATFMKSKEVLEEYKVEDDEKCEKMLEEIEKHAKEINAENHKAKTKDLFLKFHKALEYVNEKMPKEEKVS